MAARLKFKSGILASLLALPIFAAPLEDQLVTRTYKLDIAKINALSVDILTTPIPQPLATPSDLLRGLFLKEGITFPINFITPFSYAPNFRKGFYLNERTGEFHVRATRRDIPKFEKHLSQLAAGPPIVDGVAIFPPKTSVFKASPVVFGSGDLIIRSASDLH